ncbi:MAG: DUF6959 family protein [Solimonas sp.]
MATMRVEPVEIYADTSNFAVMRHPGRRFPGSLVQGDSLHLLTQEAEQLYAALRSSSDEDLRTLAQMHCEALQSRLQHYEQVLREHQLQLPYFRSTGA